MVNWPLFIFLLLVLDVKMAVKAVALLAFVIPARSVFLQQEFYRQRFTWFYAGLILIGLMNLILFRFFSTPYLVVWLFGAGSWVMCIAAAGVCWWFVQHSDSKKIRSTLTLFFLVNAGCTFLQLLRIMLDAGALNPYTYQGMYQKYFINTGDLMRGITFDVSTTNAIINAFGLFFFLSRDRYFFAICCTAALALTGSNLVNLLLVMVFLFLFLFSSSRSQKSILVVCLVMIVTFLARVSPQNNQYAAGIYQKVFHLKPAEKTVVVNNTPLVNKADSLLSPAELKTKTALLYLDSLSTAQAKKRESPAMGTVAITPSTAVPEKPSLPKDNIHSAPFQRKKDTTAYQRELIRVASLYFNDPTDSTTADLKKNQGPGKWVALKESFRFMNQRRKQLLLGMGIGNFSSKLAFRATGLRMAGGFPERFTYMHPDFREHHFRLYFDYFASDAQLHSLVNSPNSTYDQLFTEYGLAGLALFFIFYARYFWQSAQRRTYGLPLFLLMLGILGIDYWFEQFSVMILFELLMLLNRKETTNVHE